MVESLFLGLPLEGSLGPFKRFFIVCFKMKRILCNLLSFCSVF